MAETGLYLYGITDAAEEAWLGPVGVGEPPAEVKIVPLGGFAAVLSPAPDGGVAPKTAHLLAHDRVLSTLARHHTVLPVAFGTVIPGEEVLKDCLSRYRSVITRELERLRDKVEAELKAFWVPEAVVRAAGYDPARLGMVHGLHPARRYEMAVQVGQAVEATVEAWRQRFVPELCNHLAPWCLGYRLNQPLSVRMLLNAAFLVSRDREPELARTVQVLGDRYADRLSFKYVAPLPPYDFVEINLPWRQRKGEE